MIKSYQNFRFSLFSKAIYGTTHCFWILCFYWWLCVSSIYPDSSSWIFNCSIHPVSSRIRCVLVLRHIYFDFVALCIGSCLSFCLVAFLSVPGYPRDLSPYLNCSVDVQANTLWSFDLHKNSKGSDWHFYHDFQESYWDLYWSLLFYFPKSLIFYFGHR